MAIEQATCRVQGARRDRPGRHLGDSTNRLTEDFAWGVCAATPEDEELVAKEIDKIAFFRTDDPDPPLCAGRIERHGQDAHGRTPLQNGDHVLGPLDFYRIALERCGVEQLWLARPKESTAEIQEVRGLIEEQLSWKRLVPVWEATAWRTHLKPDDRLDLSGLSGGDAPRCFRHSATKQEVVRDAEFSCVTTGCIAHGLAIRLRHCHGFLDQDIRPGLEAHHGLGRMEPRRSAHADDVELLLREHLFEFSGVRSSVGVPRQRLGTFGLSVVHGGDLRDPGASIRGHMTMPRNPTAADDPNPEAPQEATSSYTCWYIRLTRSQVT